MIGLSAGTTEERFIHASDVEAKIRAGEYAEFDDCTIVGDLNLCELKVEGPVHFNHTTFRNSVNFEFTIFKGDAYFVGSAFNGDADFRYSAFNGTAYFVNSVFNGEANFGYSAFNGTADFGGSDFNRTAYFVGPNFNGTAHFEYSAFNRTALFSGSDFKGTAYFMYSDFKGTAYFEYSDFKGDAIFDDSDFKGDAIFEYSDFKGDAYFNRDTFNKEANFNEGIFKGNTSFNNSQLKGEGFFKNTTFRSTLSLTDTTYNRLFIRWHKITDFVYDDAAYMTLMKNFKDLGYLEDYDRCYIQYRKEHRDQPWPAVSGWEEFVGKLIDYPLEWFYGYGKKPFNAFFISFGIVIAFAFYWWAVGLGGSRDKTKNSLKEGEEWLDGDATDILGFSVTVFLSGTKFFIDPPALPMIEGRSRSWIKKAFILERVLGALFSVLFFIAISETIVRAT